jgi:hypothetical protein
MLGSESEGGFLFALKLGPDMWPHSEVKLKAEPASNTVLLRIRFSCACKGFDTDTNFVTTPTPMSLLPESASRNAMMERLQALLVPYEALQAELVSYRALQTELASRKAIIDQFEAGRAEPASHYTAMLEIEDTQVEMASFKATKEEYKVLEANAKEVVLKKFEAVREAIAQQCKEMHTGYTMRY